MQVLLLACLIGATSALFGEQLRRIALKELPSPMMAADAQFYNYKTDGKCNPNIGIAYTAKQVGTTPYTPLTYYYTARGQLSGIGMTLYDIPSNKSYVPQGFIDHNSVEYVGDFGYHIKVSFREMGEICNEEHRYPEAIGNTMIVNPGERGEYVIPWTAEEAEATGQWKKGSCVYDMGTHWWRDVVGGNAMTWKVGNLFPIIPMYDEAEGQDGTLNAFFFAAPGGQGFQAYELECLTKLPEGDLSCGYDYATNGLNSWGFDMPMMNWNFGPTVCGNMCEPCFWPDSPGPIWQIEHVFMKELKNADGDRFLTCDGDRLPNDVYCEGQDPRFQDIGDRITSMFMLFQSFPITAAEAVTAGWTKVSADCNSHLGYAYNREATGPTMRWPITMYYAENGLFAGIGMQYYSVPGYSYASPKLIAMDILKAQDDGSYRMSVSTRVPGDMCKASATTSMKLGYTLVVNQDGINMQLPLTARQARAAGWIRGSCTLRMGEHWWYDVEETNPDTPTKEMTWKTENIFPLIIMYDNVGDISFSGEGGINGFIIAAPGNQMAHGNYAQTYDISCTALNDAGINICWNGFAAESTEGWHWNYPWPTIRNPLTGLPSLCGNQCNTYCDFPDMPGKSWQINHILFNDYNRATCAGEIREGLSTCWEGYSASPFNDPRSVTGMDINGDWIHAFAARADYFEVTSEYLVNHTLMEGKACKTASDCLGEFYCSYNEGVCMPNGGVGDYCNVVQKCNNRDTPFLSSVCDGTCGPAGP